MRISNEIKLKTQSNSISSRLKSSYIFFNNIKIVFLRLNTSLFFFFLHFNSFSSLVNGLNTSLNDKSMLHSRFSSSDTSHNHSAMSYCQSNHLQVLFKLISVTQIQHTCGPKHKQCIFEGIRSNPNVEIKSSVIKSNKHYS